jgi:hypothetical protein
MRKDFTKSERVAIAEAMEREIGERRGNPNLKNFNDSSIVKPCTQLPLGEKTRDIVARRAGLGCGPSYQQAKQVVDLGVQELKDAMDKNTVSIRDASVLAKLPAEEQKRIVIPHPSGSQPPSPAQLQPSALPWGA